jgi:ABC-type dipeptide/oligopeptide/nickel transport system permease component
VTQLIAERLPVTIELGLVALLIASLIGIPAGILSAIRRNSAVDIGTMVGSNIGVSMPVFWLGLMLAYVFALLLKDTPFWLPPSGRLSSGLTSIPFYEVFDWNVVKDSASARVLQFFANLYVFNSLITGQWNVLIDAIRHLILPAVALATIPMAIIARMSRSSTLEVLGLDYVRTARAKGLSEGRVMWVHVLRNASIPIITYVMSNLPALLIGAFLLERFFGIPGIGREVILAVERSDFPVIKAITVYVAAATMIFNLLTDLLYQAVDPRVQWS